MGVSPRSDETSRAAERVNELDQRPIYSPLQSPFLGAHLHPLVTAVHTTGVNWQSVGTIIAAITAVIALFMGRIEASRKELRAEIRQIQRRVSFMEGNRGIRIRDSDDDS